MKRKKILVPIDFTEVSTIGLHSAMDIAKQIEADINVLHIIHDHAPIGFQTDADLQAHAIQQSERDHFMMELIKKRKSELIEHIAKHQTEGIRLIPFIEFGSFSDQLEKHLASNPPDLVVMGSTGETAISEFFSGNHASKAIRIADVPVLTVKEYYPLMSMDNLLILVSLKEYDLQKVHLIKKTADLLNLKVIIGHVKEFKDIVKGDIYYELQRFALDHNFADSKIHIIGKGEKIEAVKHFVKQHDINIIASISEGDSGLIRMIFGSDTEQFLKEIDKPLLAISQ